jgi:hypothetical protein
MENSKFRIPKKIYFVILLPPMAHKSNEGIIGFCLNFCRKFQFLRLISTKQLKSPQYIRKIIFLRKFRWNFDVFYKTQPKPEPKTRFFGKFSNPEPEPEPRIGFLKTRNPNPKTEVINFGNPQTEPATIL